MTTHEQFVQMQGWLEQNRSKFQDIDATYAVVLDGEDGGHFWLRVNHGEVSWGEGVSEGAVCTVALNAADFKKLAAGELNPVSAYFSGRVRISGDIGAAMRFGSLLA